MEKYTRKGSICQSSFAYGYLGNITRDLKRTLTSQYAIEYNVPVMT